MIASLMHPTTPVSWRTYLCAPVLVLLTACGTSGDGLEHLPPPVLTPIESQADIAAGIFQAGDSLELFVKEDPTLNGSYVVREGGYIVTPRAGRIQVGGLDRNGAERKVTETLQRTQLTAATVLVERNPNPASQLRNNIGVPGVPKILLYITGSVPKSGAHYVPVRPGKPLGLYEALLITGGVDKFGQEQRVELYRTDGSGRKHRALVDLRAIRQGRAEDPPVGEGDIINVPEKVFGF